MIEPKLSVLVAGCLKRASTTGVRLIECLLRQSAGTPDAEVLWLLDDQKVSTGVKRQRLLEMARGQFIAFVDDDDMVEDDYIAAIIQEINAIDPAPDLITFMVRYYEGGQHEFDQDFSVSYPHPHDDKRPLRKGTPSHTMAWKRTLVRDIQFDDRYYSEDRLWVDRAMKRVGSERRIGRVLYHYMHIPGNNDHLFLQSKLDAATRVKVDEASALTGLPPARQPRRDGRPHKVISASTARDRRRWWEREHAEGAFKEGVAGATPAEVIDALRIRSYLDGASKSVIEIGVGAGALIRHLKLLGHDCYGVDIAPTARARIEACGCVALCPSDEWPPADLVVSYQCLQHMPDDEMEAILGRSLASVRPRKGRVAFQYAFLMGDPIGWFAREVASGFNFVRAPETMGEMIERGNGRILEERVMEAAPGVGWSFVSAEAKQ